MVQVCTVFLARNRIPILNNLLVFRKVQLDGCYKFCFMEKATALRVSRISDLIHASLIIKPVSRTACVAVMFQ